MADSGQVVLCPALSFMINRVNKIMTSELKNIVMDFYRPEVITAAKLQLIDDVEKLETTKLTKKAPRLPNRLPGDNKTAREVDDSMTLLTYADEQGVVITLLPKYAACGPDEMPYLRVVDSDFRLLLDKLGKIEVTLHNLCSTYESLRSSVQQTMASRPTCVITEGTSTDPDYADIVKTQRQPAIQQPKQSLLQQEQPGTKSHNGNIVRNVNEHERGVRSSTVRTDHVSWALQMNDTDRQRTDTDTDTDGGFTPVQRRRRQRNKRAHDDQQQTDNTMAAATSRNKNKSKPLMIGRKQVNGNGNGNSSTASKLSAAKPLRIRKSIYCIDNLNKDVEVDDLESFVENLGVQVISCFSAVPRRTRQQKINEFVDHERRAFRLCIADSDSEKLLNPENWPEYVVISKWYFRASSAESQDEQEDTTENRPSKKHEFGSSPTGGATGNATAAAGGLTAAASASDDEVEASMDTTINTQNNHGE